MEWDTSRGMPKFNRSMPRRIEAVIKAKEGHIKY